MPVQRLTRQDDGGAGEAAGLTGGLSRPDGRRRQRQDLGDPTFGLEGVRLLCELLLELKGRTTVLIVSSAPAVLKLADMRIRVDRRKTAS